VPRDRKRREILIAAARFRDSTSYPMTRKEWTEMAQMMGVANMGGPAVHFLSAFPTPTVARGASAEEAMKSMQHQGAATKEMPGMSDMPGMAKPTSPSAAPPSASHDHMPGMPMPESSSGKKNDAMPGMGAMPHAGAGTKAASATASRSKTAVKRRTSTPSAASTTRARKSAKPKSTKAAAPAKKPTPPADHTNMPGMKMP
jgi:hypothetical protein